MEEGKKLSLAHCQKILNENGGKYTEDQVRMIRDVLYNLAELDYLILKQVQGTEISPQSEGFKPEADKAA